MAMRGGWVVFHTPILCTIGCVVTLTMTGLISILMAKPPVNRTLHDTYYIVSHLHYLLSLAVVFGFFAAWYYLFPKITGLCLFQAPRRPSFLVVVHRR